MKDEHQVTGGGITATVRADGAELCSLRDGEGREMMWGAGPAWPNHAPVLFPIVGQLAGDRLRVDGRCFGMARHGFARRRTFGWLEREADACRLELRDDDETRAAFPFAFRLVLSYRAEEGWLRVGYALDNPGTEPLPASFGAHPAFRWPLRGGAQAEYRIEFEEEEEAPILRLEGGLLSPSPRPSPVRGRTLPLRPALFEADAIIMPAPRSRSLRFLGPGEGAGGGLEFGWGGFPQLGLWQKPGCELLCIEPWHGYASPVGWDGEFRDKPGVMLVPPGETRTAWWRVRPLPA